MTIRSILIIRLSSIGDVLHCTPVARSLRQVYPECRITWLVGAVAADLLTYNPHIDEVLVWSRERFERHLCKLELRDAARMWQDLKELLADRYFDVVLDIHGLFLTGMITKQVQAGRKIGMRGAKELNTLFMTETASSLGRHVTDKYLGVLQAIGITEVDRRMQLTLSPAHGEFAAAYLRQAGVLPEERFVVVVPGTTWPSKNWPVEFFIRTIQRLAPQYRIVLGGGKAEAPLGSEIEKACGPSVINAIGQTGLLDLAGLIQKAAVVITGDTGPLHMAAALDIPTVAIFGPTDPAFFAPLGEKHIALTSRLACSFCHKTRCPDGNNMCMYGVAPDEVLQAVSKVVDLKF